MEQQVAGLKVVGTYAKAAVNNRGELTHQVFAAIIWRLHELFSKKGITDETLLGYFVDGMNYTPATPTFEDMRDGMLTAVADPSHQCLIWKAFA